MVVNITPFIRRVSSISRGSTRIVRRKLSYWTAATPIYGVTTPAPETNTPAIFKTPFRFETGYALCPKRPSRPFPPPFVSPPSSSFSDPLTTHHRSVDRRPSVNGELIRGLTNGDDAIVVSENYIGVNDGVGAWAKRPNGHAALWSRLILHFWAREVENAVDDAPRPDPVQLLQHAYEQTVAATASPNEWFGTTTSVTALLHYQKHADGSSTPLVYVTNLGDCQILVIRPKTQEILFRTAGQWHWFDCPMQLGTNSVDTPRQNAVLTVLELEEDDIVVAVSDGVTDNLWEHEVSKVVLDSVQHWASKEDHTLEETDIGKGGDMVYAAQQLLLSAREVAQDPFAQTPYMEKALGDGLAIEGGKMDDISVVLARCVRRKCDG
ncbi:hypothetical protein VTO42DRAFT_7419 [Malbranchea cinnamomea]